MRQFISSVISVSVLGLTAHMATSCGSKANHRSGDAVPQKTTVFQASFLTSPNTPFTYEARIEDCDSGFSATGITEASGAVDIPLGDANCVFKVDTMAVAGVGFTPGGSESWEAGDTYMWSNGANRLQLKVVDVMDALIEGPQTVQIQFSVSIEGDAVPVSPTTTASIDISETSAISMEVADVETSVSNAGAGRFVFSLACDSAVSGTLCDDVEMNDLKTSLIVDTTGTMDLETCFTEINNNGAAVTPFASSPEAPNGGATTVQHEGPAPMYAPANRNLMLLLSDGAERCKYYKIAITLP